MSSSEAVQSSAFINVLNDAAAVVIARGEPFVVLFDKPARLLFVSGFDCLAISGGGSRLKRRRTLPTPANDFFERTGPKSAVPDETFPRG